MKTGVFLCFLLFAVSILPAFGQSEGGRVKMSLNQGWDFKLADPKNSSQSTLDDDTGWENVNLPHTWNAADAFDEEPGYYRGTGWYKRSLKVSSDLAGKRLFLYFEGANQVAAVFVNGKNAGRHIGGYTAFVFDITDLVHAGANLIGVRVDNSFNEDIPPLTADFNFYGGIYRDVWLIAANDVHFDVTDHASSGVRITTPDISGGKGTVDVAGVLANDGKTEKSLSVTAEIFDASGKSVSVTSTDITAPSGRKTDLSSKLSVPEPQLWSPDKPYLYQLRLRVTQNGKTIDEISQPLGFRWFRFDPDTGFWLNGKSLRLRGTNRHQDYKGLGNAVPDDLHVRDLQLIKDQGFNFIRLAHYPQDPSVLEAADRLGLLIWEEIPIVNYITKSQAFTDNSLSMLQDMIRQHRNHPSVILWGYMNEIYLRVPKGRDDLYPATVDLAKKLNDLAHAEDPTRPTTMACHGSDIYNAKGLADVPDVIGWNLYLGWYGGEMQQFGPFLDDQHRRFPKRPMIVSEYGANGDLRLHSTEPRRFDSTTEYQRAFHESYLAQIEARPYLSGSALWSEFDFGSEFRGESIPHVNQKGMLTFDRQPKDVYFLYQAALSSKNIIHIATRDWAYRAGAANRIYHIDVYTNQPAVELFANGRSLGQKMFAEGDHKITWHVTMRDGINQLEAKSAKVSDSAQIKYTTINANSGEIDINAGSNADFIERSDRIWLADQPYSKGSWGYLGDETKRIYSDPGDKDILETADDPLYQTMLEGLTGYKFDVPDGSYQVTLLFAETKNDSAGKRVFSVRINGENVIENLDLAASVGIRRAFSKTFTVAAKNGITIEFIPVVSEPVVSGIRISRNK